MQDKFRVLIIEDEQPILNGLIDLFVFHGYEVDFASDGDTGLRKALSKTYDLIILDIMLPSCDGYSICEQVRAVSAEQPIIMLTAKTHDEDVVRGLSLGADDYVAKPFSVQELVLRAQALIRRTKRGLGSMASLRVGRLKIDTRTLYGEEQGKSGKVAFTRREVAILEYLQKHAERPVSRGELLQELWGYHRSDHYETRTIDIHIAKIRAKIERDPKNPQLLKTVRGEGYRLEGAGGDGSAG